MTYHIEWTSFEDTIRFLVGGFVTKEASGPL